MNGPRLNLVFLDSATFGDISLESFTSRWDCAIHAFSALNEVPDRLRRRHVVILNKVVLDRELLNSEAAKDLKLIAVAATGTDNVDLVAARERGIRVCNVAGYAAQSVAQFTLALILELATCAGRYGHLVRAGAWQKSLIYTLHEYPTLELCGKRLGIIGYGNIGKKVAEMARGFGTEVLISARPGSPRPIPEGRTPLDDLLRVADIVTLHCPLTPETKGLINVHTLALMKPTAFLINTARGALVDESALIEALRNGRLAGAAVDVLTQEPPRADHPIIKAASELKNLLVTPHCAWSTREARERLMREVAENILAFTQGRDRNRVA